MNNYHYLLPEESAEMSLIQVANLRKIEKNLREIFINENYQEVMPPNFEYVELYTQLGSDFKPEKLFQMINHEGKPIALRYDFTIPLARTYAYTRNSEIERYVYFGKVFRKEKRHKGRRTESYQIGIELLGAQEQLADKEIITLSLAALEQIPLKHSLLEIGSAKFYKRLCELVGQEKSKELTEHLKKRNISGIEQFVSSHQFPSVFKNLLTELLVLTDPLSLLRLVTATQDEILIEAVSTLTQLCQQFSGNHQIVIDLAMVPAMSYYTGLMLTAYSDVVSQPIISGGRYDELLSRFELKTTAIGFCCHMDNILKAIEEETNA
ncbi:ATP phosphoribosyltransferase regulatory subunit [Lactococcus protaetiae]|uniref:ATP phosphoribosyltransferase regulatory subunit n=1 Tax=Lactococcus protaetiae TaxID=2592653 RepID=A0A514Z974_9LACT|nr:ATP phosphoribosyltransferase regulatory subunit [Lactococcus protaetiae]MCL2113508.1 ATP phosphoribosyltransferase regulatory subunit [Streptococcaceae bacterium]QDK71135.1 ATP phosphoribosyltransferase regulatory subunit [Lactococcus protaetiae]